MPAPQGATIELAVGRLRARFDPTDGSIRKICLDEEEILRAINAPVRDAVWGTVAPVIERIEKVDADGNVRLTFEARCCQDPLDFIWNGEINLSATGELTFRFRGEARSDFASRRIGICVLHPAELQGRQCEIEHTDGRLELGQFPRSIAPHCPFQNIRRITHHTTAGTRVSVRMEGETFEMEDQRNWTDASFKTYCRPLALPSPFLVRTGMRIEQQVTLSIAEAKIAQPRGGGVAAKILTVDPTRPMRLPAFGTTWNVPQSNPSLRAAIQDIGLTHLRVDYHEGRRDSLDCLRDAAKAATACGIALEIALFAETGDEIVEAAQRIVSSLANETPPPAIARWMCFSTHADTTPPEFVTRLRTRLRESPFSATIGGGSCDNFTELNRNPRGTQTADFTVHALNPQVHATDSETIMETISVQPLTVVDAIRISGGKPAVVSPITFNRRWRLGEAGLPCGGPANVLPFKDDPRTALPLCGAWVLGSALALARVDTWSATYMTALGGSGLCTPTGEVLPAGQALAALGAIRAHPLFATSCSRAGVVDGVGYADGAERYVLAVNLTPEVQTTRVVWEHFHNELVLQPYAFAAVRLAPR